MIPTTIECERFSLRKLELGDAESITKYCQDPEVSRMTTNIPFPYSLKDGEWFVNDVIKKWDEGKAYNFGIVVDDEVVGVCSLSEVSKDYHHAELGYWLGKPYRGKGIMTKAAEEVVKFGFLELKLHRIDVWHYDINKGSQRIIEKLGFVYEGTRREAYFKNGKWVSSLMYGMLEEEHNK